MPVACGIINGLYVFREFRSPCRSLNSCGFAARWLWPFPLFPAGCCRRPAEGRINMAAEGFRGPKQLWQAFQWSMKGFRAGWRHEASFRLEACLVIVLVPLGL